MTHDITGTELVREFWEAHWDATPRSLARQIEGYLENAGMDPDEAPSYRTLHNWKQKIEEGEEIDPMPDHRNLLKRLLGYEVRDTLSVPVKGDSNEESEAEA